MLLFSDGFETYNIYDLRYKWGRIGFTGVAPLNLPLAKIVSGTDTSCNKPWATKDGRALYLSKEPATLTTSFRPSRTIMAGFAFRGKASISGSSYSDIQISFHTKQEIDRGRLDWQTSTTPPFNGVWTPTNPVATLLMRVRNYQISYTWTFVGTGVSPQVSVINTNADMLNGDYHYIQVGMTLSGNVSALPEAWCEIRVGTSESSWSRHGNILTSLPDGAGSFYMNMLSFFFNKETPGYTPIYSTVDDVYIINDEGTVNNTFLGNVKVRRVTPSADGADNASVPTLKTGDARRFQAVDEDFAGSNALPFPEPDPVDDPTYIAWEPQLEDYLMLMERGDRQSFRLHSVEFAGSSPRIFGVVLHALAKSRERGIAGLSALKGYRRSGLLPLLEANPVDTPLSAIRPSQGTWQTHPMTFDNMEVVAPGQYPELWSPAAVNDAEWVVELVDSPVDPLMNDSNLIRFNLVNDESVSEFLGFVDLTHRFYDAAVAETFSAVDSPPLYERTFKIDESLYWSPEVSVYRMFHKSVNSSIKIEEDIPWIFLFIQGQIAFADEVFLEWQDLVDESLVIDDWATGFWEELFDESIDVTDSVAASFIERLDEMFGLEEPYLWDNHELIEEELGVNVTYVWDNHELMEEYLYPDDEVAQGVGLYAESSFELTEDHFDGWLVEECRGPLALVETVLTQHWRYERFFGIVLASWQVAPVEQVGATDGNHDGDNPGGW